MTQERSEQNSPPEIDLPRVVSGVLRGDVSSTVDLDEFLRPRFLRFFGQMLPTEAEDLTQDTIMEIFSSLSRFDPSLAKGDYSQNFVSWAYKVGRSNFYSALRRIYDHADTFFAVGMMDQIYDRGIADVTDNEKLVEPKDLMPQFKERLEETLTPKQFLAVQLRMEGHSVDEIAIKLGIKRKALLARFVNARAKVEKDIFYPAGIRRISEYKDPALSQAAKVGAIDVVKFLGLFYVRDEWVKRYEPRRQVVDDAFLQGGYLLLSENTTPDEYATILGSRYSHLLIRKQGRIYVSQEGLGLFRNQRKIAHKRLDSPGDEYAPLKNFASNLTDYNRLLRAAASGSMPALKKGNWWFVLPNDALELLNT